MEQGQINWIANFIWSIADDVLRDLYVRGKYRDEAKMALFDYIEVFYNLRRRHSTLRKISPAAFERRTAAA